MKRLSMILMALFVMLNLCACSNSSPISDEPLTQTTMPTATPEPELEIFEDQSGYEGLRRGNDIIVDAIWSSLYKYEYDDGFFYDAYLNNKLGLINSNGQMIVEPSPFVKGTFNIIDHYVYWETSEGNERSEGSLPYKYIYQNYGPALLFDLNTETVHNIPSSCIDDIIDHYAVYRLEHHSHDREGKDVGWGIYDLEQDKVIYSDKCALKVELFPEEGFIVNSYSEYKHASKRDRFDEDMYYSFLSFDGKSVLKTKDGYIKYDEAVNLLELHENSLCQYYTIDGKKITDWSKEDNRLDEYEKNRGWIECSDGRKILMVVSRKSGKEKKYRLFEYPSQKVISLPDVVDIGIFVGV